VVSEKRWADISTSKDIGPRRNEVELRRNTIMAGFKMLKVLDVRRSLPCNYASTRLHSGDTVGVTTFTAAKREPMSPRKCERVRVVAYLAPIRLGRADYHHHGVSLRVATRIGIAGPLSMTWNVGDDA
jgi:hypothetical protein